MILVVCLLAFALAHPSPGLVPRHGRCVSVCRPLAASPRERLKGSLRTLATVVTDVYACDFCYADPEVKLQTATVQWFRVMV